MVVSRDNFFISTWGVWTRRKCRPRRKPDYTSFYRGEKSSEYWFTEKGVVRGSNHWGRKVARCSWFLKGVAHTKPLVFFDEVIYAFIPWADFVDLRQEG